MIKMKAIESFIILFVVVGFVIGVILSFSSVFGLVILVGEANGQTNNTETRSFKNCYTGTMSTFFLQIAFAPPQIKFNISDLMSPEVKQYVSNACTFYHDKSGVWLTGKDDELDKKIVSKYGYEFLQKVKTPESIKQRDEAYIQLNN